MLNLIWLNSLLPLLINKRILSQSLHYMLQKHKCPSCSTKLFNKIMLKLKFINKQHRLKNLRKMTLK